MSDTAPVQPPPAADDLAGASSVEPDQIRVGWVTRALILAVLVVVGCVFFVSRFYPQRAGASAQRPALHAPAPQLQLDDVADMDAMRKQTLQRLESYGWVDREAGTVHIPVERAIERVIEEHGNQPPRRRP